MNLKNYEKLTFENIRLSTSQKITKVKQMNRMVFEHFAKKTQNDNNLNKGFSIT